MNLDGCTALITGASAGIGREFARQVATRARVLVLVARREERLNELREELRNRNAQLEVHTRTADLSEKTEVNGLIAWLEQHNIEIDFLINNAGVGDVGLFATSPPQRNEEMLQLNVVALTRLTRALVPHMISRKRGAILNVSSSAGFLPIPEFNVYAASKAYVNSFTEALRAELRDTRISVTALCPGPVHTEFQQYAQRGPAGKPDSAPAFVYVSVEQTVRDALAAVEADKPVIIPGVVMKLAMFLMRITPLPILRVAWRLGARRR